jgi:hypothetical protein
MKTHLEIKMAKTKVANLMLVVGLAVAALSGCTISTHYVQDGAKVYAPTSPESVQIYVADTLSVKYDVIGSVVADAPGNGDDAAKALREEAAKMGANAVIKARLVKFTSYAARTALTGVAVRTSL